jgi:thiosulfate reductase cytochrome b subunit
MGRGALPNRRGDATWGIVPPAQEWLVMLRSTITSSPQTSPAGPLAYPTLPFKVLHALTLGGWLGGSPQWHFAAMWVLITGGVVYVSYGLASGRF